MCGCGNVVSQAQSQVLQLNDETVSPQAITEPGLPVYDGTRLVNHKAIRQSPKVVVQSGFRVLKST